MPPHPLPPIIDVTRAAEGYSGLAGILAGFSFAVLVLLVERLNTSDTNTEEDVLFIRAMVFIGITFLGNLVVSFLWALVMGVISHSSNLVRLLSYVAGWNMAMQVPLTMHAMTLVVATARSPYTVKLFRRIFIVTVIVGSAFLWSHTYSILSTDTLTPGIESFQFGIGAVFALFLALGGLVSRRPNGKRFRLDNDFSFSRFVSVGLGAMLISGIVAALASVQSNDLLIPHLAIGVANLIWAFLVAWACVFLPRQ